MAAIVFYPPKGSEDIPEIKRLSYVLLKARGAPPPPPSHHGIVRFQNDEVFVQRALKPRKKREPRRYDYQVGLRWNTGSCVVLTWVSDPKNEKTHTSVHRLEDLLSALRKAALLEALACAGDEEG